MSSPVDAPGQQLIPELADLQRQFESIQQDARELTAGLADSQFNWRPGPASWSMSECLLHLNITGESMRRPLESVIQQGRARGLFGQGPFRYGFLGNWLLRMTEPPPKRKFRASRSLTPTNGNPITALLPTFLFYQDEFIRRLHEANGLDLARIKVALPANRLLRLSLGQFFGFIAAHERRHLWQARAVRNHPQFPAEGRHRGRPNAG